MERMSHKQGDPFWSYCEGGGVEGRVVGTLSFISV